MTESAPAFRVRFYRPEDRAAVRRICAETGFLGRAVDPIFEDRELFADYLTGYYTDAEPESTLVCEVGGEIQGYLMGSRRLGQYKRYRVWNNAWLFLKGGWRYFTRPYGPATRRYVAWLLKRAGAESPVTPPGLPHFHVNLLPAARSVTHVRTLIDSFLQYLVGHGDAGVYGQMVTFDGRRGVRMFERYGWRVIDQKEITKYRHLDPRQVFLFTIVKDLRENSRLYGKDLHKEKAGA
ncbi:MAG: GNAT family acetyltransferase [Verrucomicrobium sp.]|nr:GNAT family acetyltransferase [Verrucomicrobium sp.]